MKKLNILLVIIILVAAVLRLWGLGSTPPSPDWDEAALAYNAYSIIETGRDEYGKFLPVVLQSFDDYKPALYTYLSIPSVALFGVNTFAVRLPSAFFGILTVLAVYFLLKELFGRNSKSEIRNTKQIGNSNTENSKHLMANGKWQMAIPVIATALLAISPWHIQFSRVAFETNVGLAFNVFGALFFLKGLKKPWLLALSGVSFVLSLYVYQSEKVFVPLLILALVLIYRKELFSLPKKYLVSACIIAIILAIPMVHFILTDKNALLRAKGVSIFSDSTELLKSDQIKYLDDKRSHNVIGEIFHNRRVVYVREMASGYLSHYNLNWLFIKGDLKRHHAPDMGQLYLWELPFVLIGIYFLIFGQFSKKTKLFIFAWYLLAPVPASITTGVPHAVRTLNFLPTYQIFTAVGLMSAYLFINKYKVLSIKFVVYALFGLFVAFNFIYYLNQYFVQQNYFYSMDWQYGYEQIMPDVKNLENKYDKIVVTNKGPLDQSYMFFLFYLQYPPAEYQHAGNITAGFREVIRFGKFEFRPIDWNKEEKSSRVLYIGRPEDFPGSIHLIRQVNYLDGKPAIKLVEG